MEKTLYMTLKNIPKFDVSQDGLTVNNISENSDTVIPTPEKRR